MKIVILGGGISALSAAWSLSKLHPQAEVTLLEASERLGGCIQTEKRGGMQFEKGPRTFSSARSPSLLKLISEMGLEGDLLFSSPQAKKRYLWHRGRLQSVGALLLPHAWRLFAEPFISRGREEETIHAFASRRFGRALAERLFDPLALGVYAGDSRTLSMQACFPKLAEMEQRCGSLLLAMLRKRRGQRFPGTLFTLKGGMQSLVVALASRLTANVVLGERVVSLSKKTNWSIETNRGTFVADALFPALPPFALRALFPDMPKIVSNSISVVNFGFSERVSPKRGYGYLVPSSEQEELLGMIWDSELFGGPGCRMSAMVRASAPCPEGIALEALSRHLQIQKRPEIVAVHRAEQAIPQLAVGQLAELRAWEASLEGCYLLGNYLEGPGVEQCIARSEKMTNLFFIKKFTN